MDGVIGVGFNGFIFKHGLELQPCLVGVGGEVVADQRGKCGVGELAGVDLLKANELLPAHKGLALGYGVGYLHAYIGHSGNNVATAVGFAVRANEADVDGVNDGLALDLAGDGSSAAIVPGFASPNQREGLFTANFIGISMPARDQLVVSLKDEIVPGLDGANARREVYSNMAVVLIQLETLAGVLGICVDAFEVYVKLIQLILGRLTGLAGIFRLLCLVNRGGGHSTRGADGDGIFHGLTGVRLRNGVGVVNDHGAISRDIDSDVVAVFASGNGLKRAVLAANHDGAAAFPHGVGDLDARGGDTVEVGDGDSVLKHIANSGRTLAVGNGNGLVYVELGHGRLFAAFVFDFYFSLILIVSVVRGKGRVIIAEGSRIGEDAIDHVVGAEGLGHVDHRDAVGVKPAGKAISVNCGCAFVGNLILRFLVAGHGNLVKQRNHAAFGNRYLAVNRIADAGEPFGSFVRAIYEVLTNPVQLIADFYFYNGISCARIGDFLQRQFVFRYRHVKVFAVNGADKSNAGDLIDRNARVLFIRSSISRIRIQVVDVIVSTIVIPLVAEVIGIGMLIAIAVYLYGGYLNIAGIIGSVICRIVNVGDFVLEGVVPSAGAVAHDMISRSAAGRGFRSVNDPVLVDYGRGPERIAAAVLIGLPADEILRAIVRISGHAGANALSVIDIDDVVQLPVRFPNGLEVEFYLVAISAQRRIIERQPNYIMSACNTIHVIFPIELGSVEYDTFGMAVIATISKRNGNSDTINFIRHNHAAIRSIN